MDKPHILVVDDNHINRLFLTSALLKLGCKPMAMDNGQAAITYCQQQTVDAILMDVRMHGMDGVETTQRIKALPNHRNTPVIAVSAEPLKRADQSVFKQALIKPVTSDQLRALLQDELAGFDQANALKVAHNDQAIVAQLRELYLQDLPQRISALQAAQQNQDSDALKATCHDLLGASKLVAATAMIEAIQAHNQLPDDQKLTPSAVDELVVCASQLSRFSTVTD